MQPISRLACGLAAGFLLLLAGSGTVHAQVVPDSTRQQKQELPTGPPMPTEQPRPQQRPEVKPQPTQQQPPVQTAPEVAETDSDADSPLRPIDRMYFGGSFGLQFGTFTNISLLPIIGYKVTERVSVGTGLVYHYNRYLGSTYNSYGGRAFTQLEFFNIGDGTVLGHAEAEFLLTKYENSSGNISSDRTTVTLPLVGLGYRQHISDKASVDMLLLYNVNSEVKGNPYSNPVFRVGFNIPFTSR